MTRDTKHDLYWTGGIVAALLIAAGVALALVT